MLKGQNKILIVLKKKNTMLHLFTLPSHHFVINFEGLVKCGGETPDIVVKGCQLLLYLSGFLCPL